MDKILEYLREAWPLIGTAAGVLFLVWMVHLIIFLVMQKISKRSKTRVDESIVRNFRQPTRWLALLITTRILLEAFDLSKEALTKIQSGFVIGLIILTAWFVSRATAVLEDAVLERFRVDVADNLRARRIHTQLRVFKRIIGVAVIILAIGLILMTFDRVQQLGRTILASAGIAGIVIGFAAQRTLGTFFAGLQIAFSQPIRLEDVVIVEGEWGWIEEITLTYVVVRIWDLRRLVVPITYFIEKPFQNWTRRTSDILGTIYLYTDYTVDVGKIREELKRLAEQSEHWDKKVCVLQVTNTTPETLEIRALVSASSSPKAWELRCEIREKLVAFVQKEFPEALPKQRVEFGERMRDRISPMVQKENSENTESNADTGHEQQDKE